MPISFRLALVALAVVAPLCSPLAHGAALTSGPSSTVVYVGGDDLVVKSADGKLLNFTVPAGYKFAAGGKDLALGELKPGMKLTKPVEPGSDPKAVASVSVVKGKVYAVTPPTGLTLTLADGAKDLTVPAGSSFTVAGKKLSLADLKPDMMVEATIVTTAADAAATTPATPPMAGVLLVSTPGEGELPLAGTQLPLFGLTGACLLATGGTILLLRKRRTHA